MIQSRLSIILKLACSLFLVILLAGCQEEYEINVKVEPEQAGQVYGADTYSPGDSVTVEAVPNEGYAFEGWKENGELVSEEKRYEFEAEDNRSLAASFSQQKEDLGEVDEGLPDEIKEWVEYSRNMFLAQARNYEDTTYLLVTYGEQKTGGYQVNIEEVEALEESIEVKVNFTQPKEDEVVTQALTYPYDLKEIEKTDLPVEFIPQGDEDFLPTLYGLEWLPPYKAKNSDIKILSPAPNHQVPRDFVIEGIEHVFEGSVLYELIGPEGNRLKGGHTAGHGYQWGHFEIDISLPEDIESGDLFTVKIYSECPKEGEYINNIDLELQAK